MESLQIKTKRFETLVKNIGQEWNAKGPNRGYIRDFHYRDSLFPDAFFGYQNQRNSHTGVVNSNTHWHVYINHIGQPEMQLKCYQDHDGEKVPFDNSDGELLNKIDRGLTDCWENSKRNSKRHDRDRDYSFGRVGKPRLHMGGKIKSKRIKRSKSKSNRRNKNKRTNKRR